MPHFRYQNWKNNWIRQAISIENQKVFVPRAIHWCWFSIGGYCPVLPCNLLVSITFFLGTLQTTPVRSNWWWRIAISQQFHDLLQLPWQDPTNQCLSKPMAGPVEWAPFVAEGDPISQTNMLCFLFLGAQGLETFCSPAHTRAAPLGAAAKATISTSRRRGPKFCWHFWSLCAERAGNLARCWWWFCLFVVPGKGNLLVQDDFDVLKVEVSEQDGR